MATSEERRRRRSGHTTRAGIVLVLVACASPLALYGSAVQPGGDLPDSAAVTNEPPVPGPVKRPTPPTPAEVPRTLVPRIESFDGPKVPPQPRLQPIPPPAPRITVLDVIGLGPADEAVPPRPNATDSWLPPDRPRVLPPVPAPVELPHPVPRSVPNSSPAPALLKPPTTVVSPWAHEALPDPQTLPPTSAPLPGPIIAPAPAYGATGAVKPEELPKHPWEAHTQIGWMLGRLYENVCTPYPDYQPRWQPLADAAFFVDAVRPQNEVRLRWDGGGNANLPDRAEYFWGRADGKGHGPKPPPPTQPGAVVKGESSLSYHDFSLYGEAALENTGVFIEAPFRVLNPEMYPNAAGFSDLNTGTRTLLFDCDLFQIGFIFRAYAPTGNAGRGLGTGHVSLEPALVFSVKLTADGYVQGELAEWIPLGGDADYMGTILHFHLSVNEVLFRPAPGMPVVGTFEVNGWRYQGGQFTDPVHGPAQHAGGNTSVSVGPGLRFFLYETLDFGVGTELAVTERHFAERLLRTELRLRF